MSAFPRHPPLVWLVECNCGHVHFAESEDDSLLQCSDHSAICKERIPTQVLVGVYGRTGADPENVAEAAS